MPRRTSLELPLSCYGSSALGFALQYLPAEAECELLIIGGIHGEESDGTISLSRALRSVEPDEVSPHLSVVLCANPDGVIRGTRGNANGVDLNRNFPSSNWSSAPSSCRWHADETETIPISPGGSPGSEPETQALLSLIEEQRPRQILALHGPLACIDDPNESPLGRWIANRTGLPLVTEIGYPTPGSLGSWAHEAQIPIITWEFPPESLETLSRSQVPVLIDIISRKCSLDALF